MDNTDSSQQPTAHEIIEELRNLEHAYAEALAAEAERAALTLLWQRIKAKRAELQKLGVKY